MYLLDTNACIRILNSSSGPLIERLRGESSDQIRTCSVAKAELLCGARKSSRVTENLRVLRRFFDLIACVPFDDVCAEHHGPIRAELEREGTPIGPYDLMIASTAKAHDMTLVTHNVDEFARVVGLRVEDWER
ncbi:MAG: type II toxin-antitoxin system VapC family toxin [Candidatus Eisenbacteria bacterium]|jgi:tRNA(fMet)-specific endonuclease VapC|nr:type II toxin-antitoxin system VapC family toxin [Candidatus Eisenbacteria bacterium]